MATPFSDWDRNLEAENNDINVVFDTDAINNSIQNIISISPGEILSRPTFGAGIKDYLHELIDDLTLGAIEEAITSAIEQWEPRIEIQELNVFGIDSDEIIVVDLKYTVLSNGAKGVYSETFEVL